MSDVLRYTLRDEHVAVITLNRPKRRNAMNKDMAAEYKKAFEASEADPNVRVVVLASSDDRFFCAGADLEEMHKLRQSGSDAAPEFDLNRWPRTKPWIAAVGGPAMAGGFEMVLACDMIIATENAKFAMPEIKLGMIPGAGALHRLTRFMPHNIALEYLLTGDIITGEKAREYGLANHLVDQSTLLDDAMALANKIAGNAPLAVTASLDLARHAFDLPEQNLFTLTDQRFREIFDTDDAKEGPAAFIEKRKPVWTGA